ncbi:FAD-dependent oxidoreductase [Halorarius litoreus]|uniref:FAD-dependent oxidoreductase n=1 Tax=Halorarius litoreus TaxID=2962676 RepID=UPI0020CD8112|nr:FAD-dependent oxidoreductase [Halorarius litoreus]
MSEPFVVVGGDAAGLSAASKCKREQPDREVIVFERGRWVSYAHCGMPYYIEGKVDTLGDLTSLTPEEIADRGIDLRREHEVVGLDPDAKTVTVEGPDGTFEQAYGDLLLGTGARALTGPFDGLDLDGAFTLHHMDSAAAIRAYLASPEDPAVVRDERVDADLVAHYTDLEPPERAAIVGGGYVGVEMAEALSAHGLDIHLFQRPDQLLPPFGDAVGEAVAEELDRQGVDVHTATEVDAIEGDDRVERVRYGEESVDVGLVVVGVGIRPNVEFAAEAGVDLGESGAIATDEYGRTNRESVYAAGDCAEDRHAVTGEPAWVPLGLTANRAGRAIGQTVAGEPTPTGDIAGTAVVKAFDLGAGRAGIVDEARARDAGFDPVSRTIEGSSRSGYYPGAAEMTVTMTADRETGQVLGAAVVGADRAAKRIDTVATALDAGLTVDELERLDLGYAPPFSPVWDPVLVAAKVLGGAVDAE